ncbi:hypothetical protein D046_8496, partial [Vibrio parahaemolyticus V-223/04]
ANKRWPLSENFVPQDTTLPGPECATNRCSWSMIKTDALVFFLMTRRNSLKVLIRISVTNTPANSWCSYTGVIADKVMSWRSSALV